MSDSANEVAAGKPRVKIDAWYVGNRYPGVSSDKTHLHGLALNHPRLGQTWIDSSPIVRDDRDNVPAEIETLNTIYELGVPLAIIVAHEKAIGNTHPQPQRAEAA